MPVLEQPSDVLRQFCHGDLTAFESLFRRHQSDVYGWIVRIVRDPAAAEDLTVETFWRIYRIHARFDPLRSFAPLESFKKATAQLPRTTEAERLVVQRVGQNLFRQALLDYWNSRCPLTGIADPALLRASHIIPWAECESDALRLDVHNGLLLSALWDAAFDCGLISFADDGTILRSPELTAVAAEALNLDSAPPLRSLTDLHRTNLARHRARHGISNGTGPDSQNSLNV